MPIAGGLLLGTDVVLIGCVGIPLVEDPLSISRLFKTNPSADAFDQPNVTNPSPTVNQPCPRTRFATRREPTVTDRRPRPSVITLLGNTA